MHLITRKQRLLKDFFKKTDVKISLVLMFFLPLLIVNSAYSAPEAPTRTPPGLVVEFTAQPEVISKGAVAVFSFSAQRAEHFECQLDNSAYETCSSPHRIFPLEIGAHQLSVRAVNRRGITGQPSFANWTVSHDDEVSTDVVVTFTGGPEAITKDAFAIFDFSAEGAEHFECQLDQGIYETCSSPHNVFPLAVGPHVLSVRAVSNGMNSEPVSAAWTVSSIFGDGHDGDLHPDLARTSVQPARAEPNSWRGIFRINCDFSHSSYNDPIVFPGQEDAAHLHRFYGNTLVNHNSDITSLFTSGDSTCQGNELNRSSYWLPALVAPAYDLRTGERLTEADGEPSWKAVPAVVGDNDVAHEVFYYSAGVDDLESIKPIPLGLKMIAGSHMGQPGMEQDTSIARWHCQSWESNDANNPRWSTSIPQCTAPDRLRMDLFFPSCWNGVDLDSADHKSHLAYPINTGGSNGTVCPDTHPEPIIRVSFHYAFGIKPEFYDPATQSSKGWRLAADMYDVTSVTPGGMSLHGDWFNAWNPEALQAVLDTCIKQGLDCHDGNLATGLRLSGTQPGTQAEPAVINKGLGH